MAFPEQQNRIRDLATTKWGISDELQRDPRVDEVACTNFKDSMLAPRTVYELFQYRTQCASGSGDFKGKVISIVEKELLSLAKTPLKYQELRDATRDVSIALDPNLQDLIARINVSMMGPCERIGHKLQNNFAMNRMTSGTAYLLTGSSLFFLGWQNSAVGKSTNNSSQQEDATFQMTVGVAMVLAPVINAIYYGFLGDGI